jgi:hypothetical protein
MSDVVEKNDVDIQKLFGWGRVFEIVSPIDEDEKVLVYMKLLGDADLGRARTYALRKSAEMRRKLNDKNSDEFLAWVRSYEEITEQDLMNLIVIFSNREIGNEARNSIKEVPIPKPPKSNARLKKMEEFQKEVDEYPAKKAKAVSEAVDLAVSKLKKKLSEKSKEELYREYVKAVSDEFCEREAIMAFDDMQVYLGCYTDDTYKTKFFRDENGEPSFEAFNNLEPTIKAQFKDAYRSIDIELSELKKLRRATQ